MENTDSLTQFFYNIVPGILFIKGLEIITNHSLIKLLDIQHKDGLIILFYLSFGLFVGFIFQYLTKWLRQGLWEDHQKQKILVRSLNEIVWEEIVESEKYREENKPLYLKAVGILNQKLKLSKKEEIKEGEHRRAFYLMHNYLLGTGGDKQPQFYTSRLAFWANMCFASFFFLMSVIIKIATVIIKIFISCYCWWSKITRPLDTSFILLGISLLFLIFSYKSFQEYLRSMYDSVLKTFVMVSTKNNESNEQI